MRLIVGLANPGSEYQGSRHNIGAEVVDHLARREHLEWKRRRRFRSHLADHNIAGQKVLLAKPYTYVNKSGEAVIRLVRFHRVRPEHLLVIHDDIDLPFGRLRIYRGRGSGGHNGIRSIEKLLGTNDFCRLKVGVGRPPSGIPAPEYVLSRFRPQEWEEIQITIQSGAELVEEWVANPEMGTTTVKPQQNSENLRS